MRVALLIGSTVGVAVVGAAAWSAIGNLARTPTADRLLLFELPILLVAAVAGAGLHLVGRGWPHREGDGLYCARCGHPWSPETNRLHSNCQECGAPWRWFGGRVQGRPRRSPALVLAGMLLCLLSLSVAVLWKTAEARLASSSPAWLLIRTVDLSPWYESRVQWDELMGRTLSAADRDALARSILGKRSRERTISGAMAAWFESAVTGKLISAALIDRWYDEMFRVTLSIPDRVPLGESFPVVARAQYVGGWLGVAEQPQVVVEGLRIAGEDHPRAQDRRPAPAAIFAGGGLLVDETLRPEKPGPMKVRLKVYFFIGPPLNALNYTADDTPDLGSALFARCFDLERTVEVEAPVVVK